MIKLFIILLLFSSGAFGQRREFFALGKKTTLTPVDTLPGDMTGNRAAFSMRKIKFAYAGYCLKVRRSSDNTTLDIGFSGNDFDESAYIAFVGGGNGFVDTWYDQSGLALNATQTTQANQPQIILSHKNGHPSLLFDGTDRLEIASSTGSFNYLHSTTGSFSIVTQSGTTADPNALIGYFGNNAVASASRGIGFTYDDRASVPVNNAYRLIVTKASAGQFVISDVVGSSITPNVYSLLQCTLNPTSGTASLRDKVYVNTVGITTANAATQTVSASNASFNMQIGSGGNNSFLFIGYISEIIFYNTILTAGQLTYLSNNQNAYWAIY